MLTAKGGLRSALYFLFLALWVQPATAQFGAVKERVNLFVRHPPEVYIPGRQVRVETRSELPTGHPAAAQLRTFLEQELLRANFDVSSPEPETLVRLVVTEFEAQVFQQLSVEHRHIHVRFRTEPDSRGRAQRVEDCRYADVPVFVHVACGSMSLTLTLEDIRSQKRLVEEVVPVRVEFDATIGGPRLCGGAGYDLVSEDFTDVPGLGNFLAQKARRVLHPRLFGWVEPVEALLAKPDELKPGNRLALAGQWSQALEIWRAAPIKKRRTEAYRQHNVGVAYEALGYAAEDPARGLEHLQDAEEAYSKAMQIHPGEKYFPPAFARLSAGRRAVERAQEQHAQRELEAARARTDPTEEARPVTPPAPAGAPGQPVEEPVDVKQFRDYLRMRLSKLSGKPDAAQHEAFVQDGIRWGLSAAEAERVVTSEEERAQQVRENAERYREFYRECWQDKTITPEERAQLDIFRQKLNLPDEVVAQVESELQAESSKSAPPQPKATPKPNPER